MEKERTGNRIHRRTTKMPTAAASSAQDAVAPAAAAAVASSPGGSMVAVDSSPSSRPSSPNAVTTTSSSSSATPPTLAVAPPTSATFPKYHYTRDELLSLKSCPLSRLKPQFLTPVHELSDICLELDSSSSVSSRNALDEQTSSSSSVRLGGPSKRHVSLGEQRSSGGQPMTTNSDSCDAADVHIALAPQRSSFGIGCHVAPGRNANSPEAKRERNRRDGHRIGSGRIQISEKYVEREHHDHRVMSDRERDRNDRWYDRCGNGAKVTKRDYDGRRSEVYRDGGRYLGESSMGRGGGAEQPEWFTEGPLSQSDTIELHGFDSSQKVRSASSSKDERLLSGSSVARDDAKAQQQPQPKSSPRTTQVVVMETDAVPGERREEDRSVLISDEAEGRRRVLEGRGGGGVKEENEDDPSAVSMVTDVVNPLSSVSGKDLSCHPPPPHPTPPSVAVTHLPTHLPPDPPPPPPPLATYQTNELDFNAFFNTESIPGLNDLFSLEPEQAKSGSRFQQWFHFSSHGNSHSESRRSSLTDEFGYINDIIYGHNSPLGQISPPPPNPNPLRGSQPTFSSAEKYSDETQNLLEMLQKANADGCVGTGPFNGRRWDAATAAAAGGGGGGGGCGGTMPPMNYCMSSQGDGRTTDAKDVEAGLKAILSGGGAATIFANSPLLSGLSPSMAASLALAGPPPPPLPPPFGARVLLAEELEAAHLVSAAIGSGRGHCALGQDIYSPSSGNSRGHPESPWDNSRPLSFCSLPVIPVGTKVTLLADLEAGLKGLSVVNGNHAPMASLLGGGASDCHSNSVPASSGVGRAGSSSHGDDEVIGGQQLMSSSGGSVFAGRPTDLTAYKKLLGLIVEPQLQCQTPFNNNLPIVTSPTSVSMSNLEANTSNNSLANNQRDFIQRYLLQQQQLKMLHHHHHQPHPPPPPEGGLYAPPPHHLMPPPPPPPPLSGSDLSQSYLSPGMLLNDPMPSSSSGLLISPNQQRTTEFALSPGAELQHQQPLHHHHHQQHQGSSYGYDRRSGLLGLNLNLTTGSDDFALPSHLQAGQVQGGQVHGGQMQGGQQVQGVHLATPRPCVPGGQVVHGSLLPTPPPSQQQQQQQQQHHHEMTTMTTMPISGVGQMSSKHQLLLQQESAKQAILHQASLQHQHHHHQQHQQQQLARMTHLTLHDPFGNSSKLNGTPGALSPAHPVLRPHLTLQPPPPVSSHPSPVHMAMLGPQALLHQPPQSPRRAPSPIMFGNQPPMNLTAPLPVHLGPMTPILSPTLSPNTLQVTQTGSNLSSPVMRVPSPQELSGLAQSILQNALIKKQLEEQKERFIRRQQERNKSPKPLVPSGAASAAVAMTTASSRTAPALVPASVLGSGGGGLLDARKMSQAFLPTSVLRKMATSSSSKAEERTRLTDSMSSSCSGEKSAVPLLKVVKPDEDSAAEDEDKENKALTNILTINNSSSSGLQFVSDDRLSEVPVNSSVTMDGTVSLVVAGGGGSLPQSLPSAGAISSSSAETRRLLGQGLMNNASSSSVSASSAGVGEPLSPGRLLPLSPSSGQAASAGHPNASAAVAGTSFISSAGRQIKGKKMMPEHLSLGAASLSATSKGRASSEYHHQLQQQQFFGANSSNRTAAALNLHALEMAKLLDQQQRKGMLCSPMPPHGGVAAPQPIATQFISSGAESSAYPMAPPMPRMLVHPTTFGVNSSPATVAANASNALLLQRLTTYPNLQRGALPSSVNHLNLNHQLALMQAVQLQAQQHQQHHQHHQQQQLWNRNAVRSSANCSSSQRGGGGGGAGPYPAFATLASSLPPSTATTTVSESSAHPSNKPSGAGGGGGGKGGGEGGVNGLKMTSVGIAMQTKADNDVFLCGANVHPHPNDAASHRSSLSQVALGPDAGGRLMASAEDETSTTHHHHQHHQHPQHQQPRTVGRSDLASSSSSSDVGNLSKWFGSDVFNHRLPPLIVASAGQKVLTVDEIEGWQRAIGES